MLIVPQPTHTLKVKERKIQQKQQKSNSCEPTGKRKNYHAKFELKFIFVFEIIKVIKVPERRNVFTKIWPRCAHGHYIDYIIISL